MHELHELKKIIELKNVIILSLKNAYQTILLIYLKELLQSLDLLHDSYNAIISLKLNELTAEHVIPSRVTGSQFIFTLL